MKTIGLLGGISWESSAIYYQLINNGIKERLGGHNSAKMVFISLNLEEIVLLQKSGNWKEAGRLLGQHALAAQNAGANFILIGSNTMHKVADAIQKYITIPILHIIDVTAREIQKQGFKKVGLLGTRFTMQDGFYQQKLAEYKIETAVPSYSEQTIVHEIIFEQLVKGTILDESRNHYLEIIDRLAKNGAEAVILGCTEIGMLVQQKDLTTPILDTTHIHAAAAIDMALNI